MMLAEAGKGVAYAYVLTGNGVREIRVLGAVAPKYDHSKLLREPGTPVKHGTGLTAVARALASLMSTPLRVRNYLVLVDREHVNSLKEVEEKLRGHGLDVMRAEELAPGSWVLSVRRGAREARIYVAVLGEERSIEENLARLIEVTHGERVRGDKEAVDRWLREHKLRDADLVELAGRRQLEEAFPTLTLILRELAEDPEDGDEDGTSGPGAKSC